MRFNTLDQWLSWQETLHSSEIELGLDRVRQVYQRLYSTPFNLPVISVAGTNGKGSSVGMLESIYFQAGYRVGSYSTPHLLNYNERIRINLQPIDDERLCESFERIDIARQLQDSELGGSLLESSFQAEPISLTYFEFGTLAALDIFHRAELENSLDVIILEVGLGGRLDAVNILDADVALITSIGLDHTSWLGDTREKIGFEKAGIMRTNKPVVCSDVDMPTSIQDHATQIQAPLYRIGHEFEFKQGELDWQWSASGMGAGNDSIRSALPRPALIGEHQYQNASGVLKVLDLLSSKLPVSQAHVRQGLMDVRVDGRCQIIPGEHTLILDVAHNPDSVQCLAQIVREMVKTNLVQNKTTRIHALVGMMKDKNIVDSLSPMSRLVNEWYLVKAPIERAAEPQILSDIVREFKPISVTCYHEISAAYSEMQSRAKNGDILLVFGSFYTVAAIKPAWIGT